MLLIENLIGNKLLAPIKSHYLDNTSPSTGKVYSKLPNSDVEDINMAVASAKQAFGDWSLTPPAERSGYLFKLANLIRNNSKKLGEIESIDQGKTLASATNIDVERAASFFDFFGHAILNHKSISFTDSNNHIEYINRLPIGPCALITPWNYPLSILAWKIAPCIATGNTAICKPSEYTPMSASILSELIIESGIPSGVINIVHGEGSTAGKILVEHPDVPVISFTGGTTTGRDIAKTAAPMFKKVSLEMGGKNPNIIFSDCDLEKAIQSSIRSSFWNQGEICLCGSRIFVEETIYDQFLNRFVAETDKLAVGDPKNKETYIGALVSAGHLNKVLEFVNLARSEGGVVLTRAGLEGLEERIKGGYYMRPTIIAGIHQNSRVQKEEIFGPVVTVTPFKSEQSVIEMANDTQYGLSASIWTSNISRAMRVSREIQAGTVWINTWMYRNSRAPFGGMKNSGVGREGGDYSLDFYTEIQNVSIQY